MDLIDLGLFYQIYCCLIVDWFAGSLSGLRCLMTHQSVNILVKLYLSNSSLVTSATAIGLCCSFYSRRYTMTIKMLLFPTQHFESSNDLQN